MICYKEYLGAGKIWKRYLECSDLDIDHIGLCRILSSVPRSTLEGAIYALSKEQAERLRELLDRYHKCGTQQKLIIQ